jgi:uncharacterized protein YfaS (alpha-2-macroglobulin family)
MAARSLLLICTLLFGLFGCGEKAAEAPPAVNSETAPPKAVASSEPNTLAMAVLDIGERNRDGKNGIAVTLATEVDPGQDIQPYFQIQRLQQGKLEGAWLIGEDRKQVWFMNVEPQIQYQITVNPGLRGMNGTVLTEAKSATVKTRPLQPSVNFDSKGTVLPLGYTSGLPVVTVNIAAVDVDFFRIKEPLLAEFLTQSRDNGRYGWYANQLKQYGELSYSGRFELTPEHNTRSKRDIPVHTIDALKQPGLYFAVMRAAGEYDQRHITWFTVTDIGVHIRQYRNQLDVHTSSLATGEPLRNVTLQLLGSGSHVLQENTTTAEGAASFTQDLKKARVLLARTDEQLTLIDLQQPALDLSEFELGKRPQLPVELFVYSPRDLYRPGETLILSGLLRDFDGRKTQAPVLDVLLRGPSGATVKEFKWQPGEAGYYQTEWAIPTDAPTGRWQLAVSGALQQTVVYPFNVEEFLPERMKLTLAEGAERTVKTSTVDKIILPVHGEYLYGAPAVGNRLSAFYQAEHWRSPVEALKDYQFGHLLDNSFTAHQELADFALDQQGKAELHIPPGWRELQSPLKVHITTSLYESGGRAVTRSHPVLIWPTDSLVGIRPQFGKDNPPANSMAVFDVVKAKLSGELLAAPKLEATLIREDRQYFWQYNDHQGWHWEWTEKEFPVASETLTLAAAKSAQVRFPVDWGSYRLEVRDLDSGQTTSVRFFAGDDWYHDWQNAENRGAARPDRVNLALDKSRYKVGETAQLKILPPAAGEALIMVESDRPLWSKQLHIPAEGFSISIPIASDWQSHNLYITALLVEPSGKTRQITPKRSLGLLHLPLDREERRLEVTFETPEKTRPSTTLKTRVKVTSPSGPPPAFVTLAAVDVGVLNISNFKTPDPFQHFFGPRRYAVELRDMYSDVIESQRADKAKLRFGGDADLARGGKAPQSDVQIVSLFRGPIALENGEADIPLGLPDFNGRLRLMAVAFGDEHFGSGETEVTVAAPVIMEIAMPRFLAFGDKAMIALDVQNMTEEPQTFTVSLDATAPIEMAPLEHSLTLEPRQKTTLRAPISAVGFDGSGRIRASLENAALGRLERDWHLGVRPAYPAATLRKQQVLKPGDSISVSAGDLSSAIPATLQGSVELSATVNLQVAAQLRELLAYPYGCLEQTTSRAHPLVYASLDNQARFNLKPISEEERLKRMQVGVDRVARFQKTNGGFGLWDKDAQEDQWLTAYATDFLLDARNQGLEVPESVLDKALQRLGYYLSSSGSFVGQHWSQEPRHYAFASRTYAAYILSRVKQAPLGALRTLYQRDFKDARSGLPQIHLGLALLNMGDQKAGQEALEKAVTNLPERQMYFGDYGTKVRDLGQMIYLLLSHGKLTDEALELSLQLRDAIRDRRWFSTQERTALFLSGIALEQNANQTWSAGWQLGQGAQQSVSAKGTWRKHLDAGDLAETFKLASLHDKPLYADVLLNGYGKEPPAPEESGMSIDSNWYTVTGKPVTPQKVKTGELFLIHLSVTAKERVPDALLVHLLPAGFELENQNLEHAIKLDEFRIDGKPLRELQEATPLKHREYRDDRFVAALDQAPWNPGHVFFLVRAVTPGVYQIPPPIVEDMYRPEIRAIGNSLLPIEVVSP